MDTSEVIGRFEAERQALALMDHPNIARVLDAGATSDKPEAPAKVVTGATDKPEAPAKDVDDSPSLALQACRPGRPYFVMELVRGVRITEYCDKNHLSVRERLELFTQVCNAVQHAHQKGIIHRDIKPSNVMVTLHDGVPVPKVIDFGVAKATQARLTERTVFTQYGHFIGTPAYMSPEQAEMSGLDVDTRSDIYSLGVLLYELLTGTTPIEETRLREAGYLELQRLIREEEPPKPSTRLSQSGEALTSICAQRNTEPKKLGKLLRGDLDWIVMKALEKDRTRRYATVNAFSADVLRHLRDEPVEAGPPSAAYRLRKFARKHKGYLYAAGAFATVLVAATAVSAWLALRAQRAERLADNRFVAERQARAEAEKARQAEADARQREAQERQRAVAERDRAQAVQEESLDHLARSLYEEARAVRSSRQPGRRWIALERIKAAAALSFRTRAAPIQTRNESVVASNSLLPPQPRAQLRSEAVAALLLRDARVLRTWEVRPLGFEPAVSADGRLAVTQFIEAAPQKAEGGFLERVMDGVIAGVFGADVTTSGLRLLDLSEGRELRRWEDEEMSGMVMALSPDGKLLAATNYANEIPLWDLQTGEIAQVLSWPEEAGQVGAARMPEGLTFSPDGRYLAVVGWAPFSSVVPLKPKAPHEIEREFVIWDAKQEFRPRLLDKVRRQSPSRVAFSPDSKLVCYAAGDKKVALWDLERNEKAADIELPLSLTGALALAPSGQMLAAACRTTQIGKGIIVLWDRTKNAERARFEIEADVFQTLLSSAPFAFSQDGNRLAVAMGRGDIHVFRLPSASEECRLEGAHKNVVRLLCWGSDGRHLVSWGLDGVIKRWEFSGDEIRSSVETGSKTGQLDVYSPNGKWRVQWMFNGPEGPAIRMVDRATGKLERQFSGPRSTPRHILFSDDSRRLAAITETTAQVWETSSGKLTVEWQKKESSHDLVHSGAFATNGGFLLGGVRGGSAMVWDAKTGHVVWSAARAILSFIPESAVVYVSPGARFVIVNRDFFLSGTTAIDAFDLETGQRIADWKPERWTAALSPWTSPFSGDGQWFVTFTPVGQTHGILMRMPGLGAIGGAPANWGVTVWNLKTWNRHLEIGGSEMASTYAFSPDSRLLAVGYGDGSIQLWSMSRGEEIFRWPAHNSPVTRVSFTPEGSIASVAGAESGSRYEVLEVGTIRRRLAELGLDW
jgi:WD40 repeat protein